MIFVVVKFTIRAERSHQWLSLIDDFTQATRHAAGNIFSEWSRSKYSARGLAWADALLPVC